MKHQAAGNYLFTHRKQSGLYLREVGKLIDYRNCGQISRHERSKAIPPLRTAFAYEVMFRVPLSQIFVGLYASIEEDIEDKLSELEAELGNRSASDRDANLTFQKLVWLNKRKSG